MKLVIFTKKNSLIFLTLLVITFFECNAFAAIALDRTRIIFDGNSKSMSLTITNENKDLPFLAQGWIEDEKGKKINNPILVLPPLQRLEPGESSQIALQTTSDINENPKDKESLYYFNLREIPPKSDKINSLQIALQTRIKLFYRPAELIAKSEKLTNILKEEVVLRKIKSGYQFRNPTPFYVTLSAAASSINGKTINSFYPTMIPPRETVDLKISAGVLGDQPVLSYINDYGGQPKIVFNCEKEICRVVEIIDK
ncbi:MULTISPECIES: fimbria/pilus periplasmic chaperone [Pantoea]|jgi:P pilus assembly chaperone PapD|uniref:fimbria/pilus periplasmic chaperone n=2 Tax=Gammaproteobacteria TaxID=1236 RepID=UPI000D715C96|nr:MULTISPECIES: fimbria/pilus periplasmic chaperone [Pantoea]MDC7872092.1 molecular chaperone [Pantoea ananatis]MDI3416005.1 fimbria/pilus periplasmic chaperone [Pantoea sp. V106_11]PWW11038.1 P pilus assembly chaperone PapD [Pantoea sp. AG702]